MDVAVVVPNWNGIGLISGCLESIASQTYQPSEVVVVDNGSTDGSVELIQSDYREVRLLKLGRNYGFAAAVNRGIEATNAEAVAVVNTDVVLSPDWLERTVAVLKSTSDVASVASKVVTFDQPAAIYSAGDMLLRDGVSWQRGRFKEAAGNYEEPEDVFSACGAAALYRREALSEVGKFDERLFLYLEDVELGLRLRLAGWRCRYEPVVARHVGGASSVRLERSPSFWTERNTLLIVAKYFPVRWFAPVVRRQVAWAWHALKDGELRDFLRGFKAAFPYLRSVMSERRRLSSSDGPNIEAVVPPFPDSGQ